MIYSIFFSTGSCCLSSYYCHLNQMLQQENLPSVEFVPSPVSLKFFFHINSLDIHKIQFLMCHFWGKKMLLFFLRNAYFVKLF